MNLSITSTQELIQAPKIERKLRIFMNCLTDTTTSFMALAKESKIVLYRTNPFYFTLAFTFSNSVINALFL